VKRQAARALIAAARQADQRDETYSYEVRSDSTDRATITVSDETSLRFTMDALRNYRDVCALLVEIVQEEATNPGGG
jgi:hypothetical protein